MTTLQRARREEAQAIAALLQMGAHERRLLERLAQEESLPIELRARAHAEARAYLAGCERFARASGAKSIATAAAVLNNRLQRPRRAQGAEVLTRRRRGAEGE